MGDLPSPVAASSASASVPLPAVDGKALDAAVPVQDVGAALQGRVASFDEPEKPDVSSGEGRVVLVQVVAAQACNRLALDLLGPGPGVPAAVGEHATLVARERDQSYADRAWRRPSCFACGSSSKSAAAMATSE